MIRRFNLTDENAIAPDFEAVDTRGEPVCLSDFRNRKSVVLVLARGFA